MFGAAASNCVDIEFSKGGYDCGVEQGMHFFGRYKGGRDA
jgi:hypothetical protein